MWQHRQGSSSAARSGRQGGLAVGGYGRRVPGSRAPRPVRRLPRCRQLTCPLLLLAEPGAPRAQLRGGAQHQRPRGAAGGRARAGAARAGAAGGPGVSSCGRGGAAGACLCALPAACCVLPPNGGWALLGVAASAGVAAAQLRARAARLCLLPCSLAAALTQAACSVCSCPCQRRRAGRRAAGSHSNQSAQPPAACFPRALIPLPTAAMASWTASC